MAQAWMKYPMRITESTPYYERHFLNIEETPHAYVSAFREAQYDALQKRRSSYLVFWIIVLVSGFCWLLGYLHVGLLVIAWSVSWVGVSLRNRHEARLLARTFELALADKDREFHEYMWRHLDRSLLWQKF